MEAGQEGLANASTLAFTHTTKITDWMPGCLIKFKVWCCKQACHCVHASLMMKLLADHLIMALRMSVTHRSITGLRHPYHPHVYKSVQAFTGMQLSALAQPHNCLYKWQRCIVACQSEEGPNIALDGPEAPTLCEQHLRCMVTSHRTLQECGRVHQSSSHLIVLICNRPGTHT